MIGWFAVRVSSIWADTLLMGSHNLIFTCLLKYKQYIFDSKYNEKSSIFYLVFHGNISPIYSYSSCCCMRNVSNLIIDFMIGKDDKNYYGKLSDCEYFVGDVKFYWSHKHPMAYRRRTNPKTSWMTSITNLKVVDCRKANASPDDVFHIIDIYSKQSTYWCRESEKRMTQMDINRYFSPMHSY